MEPEVNQKRVGSGIRGINKCRVSCALRFWFKIDIYGVLEQKMTPSTQLRITVVYVVKYFEQYDKTFWRQCKQYRNNLKALLCIFLISQCFSVHIVMDQDYNQINSSSNAASLDVVQLALVAKYRGNCSWDAQGQSIFP